MHAERTGCSHMHGICGPAGLRVACTRRLRIILTANTKVAIPALLWSQLHAHGLFWQVMHPTVCLLNMPGVFATYGGSCVR